jgi:hypothetical protein
VGRLKSLLALSAVFILSVLPATAQAEDPAPSVSLDPYPEYTSADALTFTGTAAHENSPIASVEYRIDDGPWLPAAAVDGAFGDAVVEPYAFTTGDLDDGWHTVDVKATTKAGYSTAPEDYATAHFCVDTVPPTISIVPLSPDTLADDTPTLLGNAQDSTSPVAAVEFRLDGGPWSAAQALDGNFDSLAEDYSFTITLADGQHTVQARARDAAGNFSAPAADTFAIDTTAPSLALESLPAYIGMSTVVVHGTGADAISPVAAVEGSLDGGPWTAATSPDGAFDEAAEEFALTVAGLGDGAHTVDLRAADALGNITGAADYLAANFIVDTAAPTVLLLPVGSGPTSDSTPDFSGSASDATSPVALVQYRLDGGHWIAAAAADGAFDEPHEDISFTTAALSDGAHFLELMAIDAAGNMSGLDGHSFSIDTTSPSVCIKAIPDSVGQLNLISGTASDAPPGQIARVQVAVARRSDGAFWDGTAWVQGQRWLDAQGTDSWSYAPPALEDGHSYSVGAVSVDTAGNLSGEAVESFTVVAQAPSGDDPPSSSDPPAIPDPPDGETASQSRFSPWWWLLASGLAVSGLIAIALLMRARKGRTAT